MKLSCIDQSVADGDCYLLSVANVSVPPLTPQRVVLFGSLMRQSSLLRYLPGYFDFVDDSTKVSSELSPKAQKRLKQEEKHAEFASLLKPANSAHETFSSQTFSTTQATVDVKMLDECCCTDKHAAPQMTDSVPDAPDCQTYFKKIEDELFIDGCATKFDLRHFNFLAVKDIQIVFVSTFQELYGAPFLSMHPQFKGKIFMTQPLMQIGQNLLLEFSRINAKRNT